MTSTSAHPVPIAPAPATAVVSGPTVDAANEGLPVPGIRRRRLVTLIAVLIWFVGLVVPFRWVPGVEWVLERIGSPTVDAYLGTVVSRPVVIWTATERDERLEWSPDEAATPGGYSYDDVAGLCAGDGVVDLGGGRRYRLNCPTIQDADLYALVDVYRQSSDGVREPVHSDHPAGSADHGGQLVAAVDRRGISRAGPRRVRDSWRSRVPDARRPARPARDRGPLQSVGRSQVGSRIRDDAGGVDAGAVLRSGTVGPPASPTMSSPAG